jgi:ribokinase
MSASTPPESPSDAASLASENAADHGDAAAQSEVVVLGSANVDHILAVERLPAAGETVLAESEMRGPGGKGLNQAVAAARAGAGTDFIGAVGDDDGGALLRAALGASGVGTSGLRTSVEPTGEATVVVGQDGENLIVVSRRANATVTDLTAADRAAIAAARVLLCQLEVPVSVVLAAARWARASTTMFILNAAPAGAVPAEVWSLTDLLVVNESEAAQFARDRAGQPVPANGDVVAELGRLVGAVVVTRGARGAEYSGPDRERLAVAAPAVTAIDTTGAGDTFCGVLAAGIAGGLTMTQALHRAAAAGAWSVQRRGTTESMPTAGQLDGYCAELARTMPGYAGLGGGAGVASH